MSADNIEVFDFNSPVRDSREVFDFDPKINLNASGNGLSIPVSLIEGILHDVRTEAVFEWKILYSEYSKNKYPLPPHQLTHQPPHLQALDVIHTIIEVLKNNHCEVNIGKLDNLDDNEVSWINLARDLQAASKLRSWGEREDLTHDFYINRRKAGRLIRLFLGSGI